MTYVTHTDGQSIDTHVRSSRLVDVNKMLMGKGNRLNSQQLSQLETPPSTRTHVPIPHSVLVDMLRHIAMENGLRILQEAHLTDHDNKRYFGLFQVSGGNEDLATMLGLRNGHDKVIPVGLCAGNAPTVCSNLMFNAEFLAKARHTLNVYSTVYERMKELVERAQAKLANQWKEIENMQNAYVSNAFGDAIIWDAVNADIVTLKQAHRTREQWRSPEHDEFIPRNAWSLQNAFTNVFRDEANRHTHLTRTTQLRRLLDKEFKFRISDIYS